MRAGVCFVAVLIGYVFGLFQTAYIYGKMRGVDIRKIGSGNAGTTNALRNFGTKAGAIVFIGDFLKCVVAVVVVKLLLGGYFDAPNRVLGLYAALGCILGHNFPFYLNFKGGKGIACSWAAIMMFSPLIGIIAIIIFIAIFKLTHYVSLGSLTGTAAVFLICVIGGALGFMNLGPIEFRYMAFALALITALAFFQHRANIARLIAHNENKTYL